MKREAESRDSPETQGPGSQAYMVASGKETCSWEGEEQYLRLSSGPCMHIHTQIVCLPVIIRCVSIASFSALHINHKFELCMSWYQLFILSSH